MKINDAGVALIKKAEGLRLQAYPDPAHGWAVPTIGYGHTSAAGEPTVVRGMSITAKQADEILRRDLGQYEQAVEDAVTVPLNENQFSALVSFTFNLGAGNLGSSTLLKKLNAGDYAGAANEFLKWNKAGGKVLAGLNARRAAERTLFLTPSVYADPLRELQTILIRLGYDLGPTGADGVRGRYTDAALEAFNTTAERVYFLSRELLK